MMNTSILGSLMPQFRTRLAVAFALVLLSLAGCGQKGPLYMPNTDGSKPANGAPADEATRDDQ